MWDFFSGIWDAGLNWVVDIFGNEVAAVVGTAAIGAVSGAVIGAAVAAIQGEDILDGALSGAAYGGITAGVVSTFGQITDTWTASDQLSGMGWEAPTDKIKDTVSNNLLPTDNSYDGHAIDFAGNTPGILNTTPTTSSKGMSDSTAKILAGVGQGAAAGAGEYLAAGTAADSAQELLDQQTQIDKDKIAANQPSGTFEAKTANITVKSWWDEHMNTQTGLLNTGVA